MFTLGRPLFQMEGDGAGQDPFLRGLHALGFLADQTERIALAPLVTGVTTDIPVCWLRRPHVGRVVGRPFGVRHRSGLVRARASGPSAVPLPARVASDSRCSKRALQDLRRRCGATTTARTSGKHYRLPRRICQPQPISAPADPDRRCAARRRHCGWSPSMRTCGTRRRHRPRANSRTRSTCCDRHCEAAGRDPAADIRLTAGPVRLEPARPTSTTYLRTTDRRCRTRRRPDQCRTARPATRTRSACVKRPRRQIVLPRLAAS